MSNAVPHRYPSLLSRVLLVGLLVVGIGGIATAVAVYGVPGWASGEKGTEQTAPSSPSWDTVKLVEGKPNTIAVPADVRDSLSIGAPQEARAATAGRPLTLPGSTALDPTRMMRVRVKFNAEVFEIHKTQDPPLPGMVESLTREIRPGDVVTKGDVLAVVWSVDVGSKKSDLVDALIQLRLDEQRLQARLKLWREGTIPDDTLAQTRRDVVSDQNAVDRAERTLRTWAIPEAEIQAVKDEVEHVFQRQGKRDKEKEKLWARCELVAPITGTIVERNVGVGEFVSDTTANLFTVADVKRLLVMVNPPEDVLPELLALPPGKLRWSLQTVGAPATEGTIDEISYILDPNLHTAVVKGYIGNQQGKLRAGQFVTATVELPPPPDVVEVPLTGLVEDGRQSFVFVQPDPGKQEFTLRRVKVTHRFDKVAFVRSKLTPEEEKLTPDEKARGFLPLQPLAPGERYLPSGVLELRSALEDKLSKLQP
jgi:cobalt-zinc-cadmium efflux system membrane fusion protein